MLDLSNFSGLLRVEGLGGLVSCNVFTSGLVPRTCSKALFQEEVLGVVHNRPY